MTLRLSFLCALFASSGWLAGYYMSGQRSSSPAPSTTPAYGIAAGSQSASTDTHDTAVFPGAKSTESRMATAMIDGNYEQALQSALADRNPVRRAHLLYAIASKLDPGQIPAALANAQKMTSQTDRSALIAALIGHWAEAEPLSAIKYAQALRDSGDKTGAFSSALTSWIAVDPKAALAWTLQLPAGQQRSPPPGLVLTGVVVVGAQLPLTHEFEAHSMLVPQPNPLAFGAEQMPAMHRTDAQSAEPLHTSPFGRPGTQAPPPQRPDAHCMPAVHTAPLARELGQAVPSATLPGSLDIGSPHRPLTQVPLLHCRSNVHGPPGTVWPGTATQLPS